MRNRYYNPQTGQFTQPDPIGLAGGLNSYGYANGDPASNHDPLGTCAWGIGRDAALGRCSDTDIQHAPPPQDECRRSADGLCETYIPTDEWERVGRQIRRIPNTQGKCSWIRSRMLDMWRLGPEARHFRFWRGLDVWERHADGRPKQWRVGQYIHDPSLPYFEFEDRVFFESTLILPHEGLHMYYYHFPEPGVSYEEVLHPRIYREARQCRLR